MSQDPVKELNTLTSRAELAAAAVGSMYAVNELGKAIADNDDGEGDHYTKAAIGAAVAIGAFYHLQNKVSHEKPDNDNHHSHRHYPEENHEHHHPDPPHYTRHRLEEAAAMYSVGKELLGDKRHHIAHLVAETLGAIGAIKDINARHRDQEFKKVSGA